jgi:hypothetical protein
VLNLELGRRQVDCQSKRISLVNVVCCSLKRANQDLFVSVPYPKLCVCCRKQERDLRASQTAPSRNIEEGRSHPFMN